MQDGIAGAWLSCTCRDTTTDALVSHSLSYYLRAAVFLDAAGPVRDMLSVGSKHSHQTVCPQSRGAKREKAIPTAVMGLAFKSRPGKVYYVYFSVGTQLGLHDPPWEGVPRGA